MNLNEHAEVDKLFMKSQVVMLIARPRAIQKRDTEQMEEEAKHD